MPRHHCHRAVRNRTPVTIGGRSAGRDEWFDYEGPIAAWLDGLRRLYGSADLIKAATEVLNQASELNLAAYLAQPALVARLCRSQLVALLAQVKALEGMVLARLLADVGAGAPAAAAPGRLLTAKEMAQVLHVPESWVRAQARAERIPRTMVGRYTRFDPVAVQRALADG
jgi:excisionase family DNA binding protein